MVFSHPGSSIICSSPASIREFRLKFILGMVVAFLPFRLSLFRSRLVRGVSVHDLWGSDAEAIFVAFSATVEALAERVGGKVGRMVFVWVIYPDFLVGRTLAFGRHCLSL